MFEYGIEQAFHLAENSEICNRRRALLNEKLASRAGLDFLQAGDEVVARNLQRPQFRRYGAVGFKRHDGKETPQRNHADFLAQRFEIGADEAVRMLSDLLE